jgi:O-antigen/teichoic acid export membrane protein
VRRFRLLWEGLWGSVPAWSFAATLAMAGYGLATLPAQVMVLDSQQMGLWYVLMSVGSLGVMVCNGGISPTIQRFASYYAAGAERIEATGTPAATGTGPNRSGMADLAHATSRLFTWLATGLLLVWLVIGLPVMLASLPRGLEREGLIAWTIHGIGLWLLIMAAGRTALVQGSGDMLASQRWLVISRLAAPVAGVTALLIGCGVVSLGIATLMIGGVQYLGHGRRFGQWASPAIHPDRVREHLLIIWPTTWRFSLVTGSAWMITSAGTAIVGACFGLAAAGSYGLTVQVIQFATTLGAVWMSSAVPRLCSIRALADHRALRVLFLQRWALGLGTYIVVAAGIVSVGPWILAFLGSQTSLLPMAMVLVLVVIYLLELNHGPLCAAFIMTGNQVPFLFAAVGSGLAIVVGALILSTMSMLGMWSVILSQGFVQLAYNNWKWPYVTYRILVGDQRALINRRQKLLQ